MNINNGQELKEAVRRREPELLITNPQIINRVQLFMTLRLIANILVFFILAMAIFMWANPLRVPFFEGGEGRLTRQILLGVGIILLFAEYLVPVARLYKVASKEKGRLRLILRRPKG